MKMFTRPTPAWTNANPWLKPANICLLIVAGLAIMAGCRKSQPIDNKDLRDFQQVNLVANKGMYGATLTDPTLQNAWGLAWSPTGIAWVNAQAGHVSELYTAEGTIVRPPVDIPSPADTIGGNPTGIVFSGGKGFNITTGATNFLFVGVDGILSGWNGAAGNRARVIGNNAATSSYTGLALAASGGRNYIYAANFETGKIDVWDTTYTPVHMSFWDPALPRGFAPFNIQLVGSWLYVLYAKVGPNGKDKAGAGWGLVDIFNTDGSFVTRFASGGALNAPWGVTLAPAGFLEQKDMVDDSKEVADNSGPGSHNGNDTADRQQTILVGNFGDGRINVYTLDGHYRGQLQSHNRTIVIDGLWALSFAPSTATTVNPGRLYFTAGPAKETDGLFGYLIKQ